MNATRPALVRCAATPTSRRPFALMNLALAHAQARGWTLAAAGAVLSACGASESDVAEPTSWSTVALGGGNCYGAVGPNCNGAPEAPCTLDSATNTYVCQVSVGSQMHDTCCGAFSDGFNCNPRPPFIAPLCTDGSLHCCNEWNHAFDDTAVGRQFTARFKGDDQSIPGPLAHLNGSSTESPTPFSYLVPGGAHIWIEDAKRGWCKFGFDAGILGDAVCKSGPASSPNPCASAPSHAAFCGYDSRYDFNAHSVSAHPNTLYTCDDFRVDRSGDCPAGCQLGQGPANDSCAPPPP